MTKSFEGQEARILETLGSDTLIWFLILNHIPALRAALIRSLGNREDIPQCTQELIMVHDHDETPLQSSIAERWLMTRPVQTHLLGTLIPVCSEKHRESAGKLLLDYSDTSKEHLALTMEWCPSLRERAAQRLAQSTFEKPDWAQMRTLLKVLMWSQEGATRRTAAHKALPHIIEMTRKTGRENEDGIFALGWITFWAYDDIEELGRSLVPKKDSWVHSGILPLLGTIYDPKRG